MKPESEYQRVIATIPEAWAADGDSALDADGQWLYFRIGKPAAARMLKEGTKIEPNFGPRNMGAGPTGIAKVHRQTGEIRHVISVGFQIGHIQANPWQPGELVFSWETGGKSPQRTWTVKGDGTGLAPVFPEADFDWVTHEAIISKDEVAFAIMGHRPVQGAAAGATSWEGRNPGQEAAWGPSGTRERPTGLGIANLRTARDAHCRADAQRLRALACTWFARRALGRRRRLRAQSLPDRPPQRPHAIAQRRAQGHGAGPPAPDLQSGRQEDPNSKRDAVRGRTRDEHRCHCLARGLVGRGAVRAFLWLLALLVGGAWAEPAPKPLYRDPVFDGAADASVVYNRALSRWELFYTNRRATLRLDDPKDVSWVHGARIGIAATTDGNRWQRVGELEIPAACAGDTHWAPELLEHEGVYHLWLTIVPGIHSTWSGPRHIEHLTSRDLREWHCEGRVDLGSDKVIDAAVVRLPSAQGGGWRIWFKDEAAGSRLFAADSTDLKTWTRHAEPVAPNAAEGPTVFRFQDRWWLIADRWRGLQVLRSADLSQWQPQPLNLLEQPGRQPSDRGKGQHPGVVVQGGRAFLFYFVHQGGDDALPGDDRHHQRSVIQVAELRVGPGGWLFVDREAPPPDLRKVFAAGDAPLR